MAQFCSLRGEGDGSCYLSPGHAGSCQNAAQVRAENPRARCGARFLAGSLSLRCDLNARHEGRCAAVVPAPLSPAAAARVFEILAPAPDGSDRPPAGEPFLHYGDGVSGPLCGFDGPVAGSDGFTADEDAVSCGACRRGLRENAHPTLVGEVSSRAGSLVSPAQAEALSPAISGSGPCSGEGCSGDHFVPETRPGCSAAKFGEPADLPAAEPATTIAVAFMSLPEKSGDPLVEDSYSFPVAVDGLSGSEPLLVFLASLQEAGGPVTGSALLRAAAVAATATVAGRLVDVFSDEGSPFEPVWSLSYRLQRAEKALKK